MVRWVLDEVYEYKLWYERKLGPSITRLIEAFLPRRDIYDELFVAILD